MENKKLLKYLLKDLSELEEMFAEKGKNSFDELEMEFIQNRVSGAKRFVGLFLEMENITSDEVKSAVIEEIAPQVVVQEEKPEIKVEEKVPETIIQEKVVVIENKIETTESVKEKKVEIKDEIVEITAKQTAVVKDDPTQQELQMDDEDPVDIHNKRLGDSFLKEKSVNDIMSDDLSKLEHKLSNRPVASIQSAIGINDRFQYIRELFEGSTDNFVKTVADLDSMGDIKQAVDYLQSNFKWKKNETSLKFVNLIKRRFLHE